MKEDKTESVTDNLYELEYSEYTELKRLIKIYEKSTPRGIRIYYYRYLLSRSLFDYILKNRNLVDLWNAYENKEILPRIVLHFSMENNISKLNEARPKIMSDENKVLTIKLIDKDYNINENLLNSLLDVVEMVVPY